MGNSLPTEIKQETLLPVDPVDTVAIAKSNKQVSPIRSAFKPLATPLRPIASALKPCRAIPSKIKNFAKVNIGALAKRGLKLHPRYHLKLAIQDNEGTLQTIVKFLNGNRMRIASLRKLSVRLGEKEILPLLMTPTPIRPLVKALGKRLSRLRNLESAEIGSSHLNAFCIEETLIEALTKMKKISSLSLGIPDNQKKINFIAKKLVHLKTITRLNLDFFVANNNLKPILNSLRWCSRLQVLRINLANCTVDASVILKIAEMLKTLRKLEYLIIHLDNTDVEDEEIKLLYETIEEHCRVGYFKIYLDGCTKLSWWLRAMIYTKENFTDRC